MLSLQDTNITKLKKDDNFPFQFDAAFEMDVVSFLALDSTVQINKFKSFFTKLEEENILAKTEKLFMTKKLDKLEKEIRSLEIEREAKKAERPMKIKSTKEW